MFALDVLQEKVDMINSKMSPILDKEIKDYLMTKKLNLTATTDNYKAFRNAEYVIIPTPTNYDPEKIILILEVWKLLLLMCYQLIQRL